MESLKEFQADMVDVFAPTFLDEGTGLRPHACLRPHDTHVCTCDVTCDVKGMMLAWLVALMWGAGRKTWSFIFEDVDVIAFAVPKGWILPGRFGTCFPDDISECTTV